MKGSYADQEVTGVGYNVLGDHSVPENWVQHAAVNTTENSAPGTPVVWSAPENPDDVVAGYGYVQADTSAVEETFYYHSDHLGSTSYITDKDANVTQYDAYLPYGELLVDEHSSSTEMPYKFNGKELDSETGLYYYGARYMNPITSLWYGVDPLAEKYVSTGAYVYCVGNPVKFVDPDGREKLIFFEKSKDNKINIASAKAYKENDKTQIHIFCHGGKGFIKVSIKGKTTIIKDGAAFFQFLQDNSKEFKSNLENKKHSIIVLHSCNAASPKEEKKQDSFVEKISNSELFDDDVIIGANGLVKETENFKVDNKTKDTISVNYFLFGVKKDDGTNGLWFAYRNGKKIRAMSGKNKPEWKSSEF